jgi:hypothetical protein
MVKGTTNTLLAYQIGIRSVDALKRISFLGLARLIASASHPGSKKSWWGLDVGYLPLTEG